MIETALKIVDKVDASEEHFLVCGVVSESDIDVRELYIDMARSYSIDLPIRGSEFWVEWRIIQEFRLSNLGYTSPNKAIDMLSLIHI